MDESFFDRVAKKFNDSGSIFILRNAKATDFPIVYCTEGFCIFTKFTRPELLGKCVTDDPLFSNKTSGHDIESINGSFMQEKELKQVIKNLQKKPGELFDCEIEIIPILNDRNETVLFLVSYSPIKNSKDIAGIRKSTTAFTGIHNNLSNRPKHLNVEEESGAFGFKKFSQRQSLAFLYQLGTKYTNKQKPKNKINSQLKWLAEAVDNMAENRTQEHAGEAQKECCIILHYKIPKVAWDWLILASTFYVAIMVPFSVAFLTNKAAFNDQTMVLDIIIESFFIVDIVFNFRTTYVNRGGQVVYDSKRIACHYLKTWFVPDLLAAIPYDTLIIFEDHPFVPIDSTETSNYEYVNLIHLLKVARLLRLIRMLQRMERYFQYSAVILVLLMSTFALIAHWLACLWYIIGREELSSKHQNWTGPCWLMELAERSEVQIVNQTYPHLLTAYVSALYFTCTSLTSVGFGNVSANTDIEKIFAVIVMLLGAIVHALVFGNVIAIVQRMYARRATYHSKTKDLKDFFLSYNIPRSLQKRIMDYFHTRWRISGGITMEDILKDFPKQLQAEIMLILNTEFLSLPLFDKVNSSCRKALAMHIKSTFCPPGEYLIHYGDIVHSYYFIHSGSMEVLKDGSVVALLGKGDLCGPSAIFCKSLIGDKLKYLDDKICGSKCGFDLRSLTFCNLLCLNIHGLLGVLQGYPEYSPHVLDMLVRDLTYNITSKDRNILDTDIKCLSDHLDTNSLHKEDTHFLDETDINQMNVSPKIMQRNDSDSETFNEFDEKQTLIQIMSQLDNLQIQINQLSRNITHLASAHGIKGSQPQFSNPDTKHYPQLHKHENFKSRKNSGQLTTDFKKINKSCKISTQCDKETETERSTFKMLQQKIRIPLGKKSHQTNSGKQVVIFDEYNSRTLHTSQIENDEDSGYQIETENQRKNSANLPIITESLRSHCISPIPAIKINDGSKKCCTELKLASSTENEKLQLTPQNLTNSKDKLCLKKSNNSSKLSSPGYGSIRSDTITYNEVNNEKLMDHFNSTNISRSYGQHDNSIFHSQSPETTSLAWDEFTFEFPNSNRLENNLSDKVELLQKRRYSAQVVTSPNSNTSTPAVSPNTRRRQTLFLKRLSETEKMV